MRRYCTESENYLEIAGSSEHGLDGPHAVVVVMLGRQLLRTQSVHSYDFHRQRSRLDEPARVEGDLSNHRVVRNHHGHSSEQSLKCEKKEKKKTYLK